MVPLVTFAQDGKVSGTVKDASGEPLIGVNVVVQGTTIGTVTDIDGNFILSGLPSGPLTIEASFIGYLKETYAIDLAKTPNAKIQIVLVEDIEELSEVVVIGYGTQKKSDVTSAVASVSAEDLEKSQSANISEALQGKVSGVKVSSNTGAPGSGVSVQIRGITSINGTNPLWIIDGVGGDPNSISPNDIESMEILKDASAAAIYGANGGSGVILITTKKGKAGKTQVNFNAYYGVQNVTKTTDLNSGPDYARMYHEYQVLSGVRANKYYSTEPDTFSTYDYQDMIFRKASMQSYDISAAGGNEKSTFYLGASYTNQEGVLIKQNYDKLTARVNGEHKANDWFAIGINSNFSRQKWEGKEEWQLVGDASPILGALTYHTFVAPYTGTVLTESEYDEGWSPDVNGNTMSPLASIALQNRQSVSNNTSGALYAKITPIDGLEFQSKIYGSTSNSNTYSFEPIYYITSSLSNDVSQITKSYSDYFSWGWQNTLTYNKTLFDVHNLSFLLGYESGYNKSEWMQATRNNLINQSEEMWYFDASLDNTSTSQLPTGSAQESSGYSYFGRISYDYKGMFLLQANLRHDYSSLFGPSNRDGIFPSFSGGFKFTELDAVRNMLPFLNFGKIRAGWGKVGNNTVGYYSYYPTVASESVYGYYFSDATYSTGAAPNQVANYDIAWEEVVTTNIGLDLRFLDSKLSFTADYFNRHNNGMIMEVEVPDYWGWSVRSSYQEGGSANPYMNVGNLSNKGIELALDWKETRGKFSYGVNGNITFTKTEVGDISPDTLYLGSAKGISSYITRMVANSDFDIFYGYQTDGLFRLSDTPNGDASEICTNQPYTEVDGQIVYAQPNAKPGDFKFKDVNKDGQLNEEDIVSLGSPYPKFTYSFGLNADYELPYNLGKLDMTAFFQGEYGNKVFNATKFYLYNIDGSFNWGQDYYDNHYTSELYDRNDVLVTEANDDAKYPRLDPLGSNNNFTTLSDFYIEDASYFRLKSLELGYTIPKSVTEKIKITRIRIYGSGQNLFTITKYSGLDPEAGVTTNDNGNTNPRTAGIDKAAYPTARMFSLGINVTF